MKPTSSGVGGTSVSGTAGISPTSIGDAQVAAAVRGDLDAFGELYRCHVDQIYRFCLRRTGRREAAEDATAQVFLKALAALPSFRGGSFQGWLFTIANRVVLDGARSARAFVSIDAADEVADPAAGPEGTAIEEEAAREIRALLGRLSVEQRRVVELRLAGLTGVEIAQALGRTHGTIRNLQHRTLRRLRDLYELSTDADREGRTHAGPR